MGDGWLSSSSAERGWSWWWIPGWPWVTGLAQLWKKTSWGLKARGCNDPSTQLSLVRSQLEFWTSFLLTAFKNSKTTQKWAKKPPNLEENSMNGWFSRHDLRGENEGIGVVQSMEEKTEGVDGHDSTCKIQEGINCLACTSGTGLYTCLMGAECRAVLVEGCHQKSTWASFFF